MSPSENSKLDCYRIYVLPDELVGIEIEHMARDHGEAWSIKNKEPKGPG